MLKLKQILEVNGLYNKKLLKFVDDYIGDMGAGSPQYQWALKELLKATLVEANFHSESKKVDSLFRRAQEPENAQQLERLIRSKAYDIAKMADWDANTIVDGFAFVTSMRVGRPVGEKVEQLLEGKSVKKINESASDSVTIASFTGTRRDAVDKFIEDNNIDASALAKFVQKGKLQDRLDVVSAIAGKPGNKYQQMIINKFKLQ